MSFTKLPHHVFISKKGGRTSIQRLSADYFTQLGYPIHDNITLIRKYGTDMLFMSKPENLLSIKYICDKIRIGKFEAW